MHTQIVKLLAIQEKDIALLGLEEEKGSLPLALGEAKARLAAAEERLSEAHGGMKELQVKRKELELDSESVRGKIDKYEQQLFAIKSNAEYQALQKEITDRKIENSRIEDRILEVMEEAEEREKKLKECEADVAEAKAVLSAEEKKVAEETARLDGRIREVSAERDSLLPEIEGSILKRYRRILEKKRNEVVVPLVDYACGGCHMRLPPNEMVNVRKTDRLVICENCSRILYWPEGVRQTAGT